MPVCIAPTAMHRMAHPDGEVATAKGMYVFNTLSGSYLLPLAYTPAF